MSEEIYSISQAMDFLGVSRTSLIRWEDEKKIPIKSIRTPGGHRRYKKIDLENLLELWGNKEKDN